MRKITRVDCPQALVEKGEEWTQRLVERGYWTDWPRYRNRRLNQILNDEGLRSQTQEHCSYCDSTPISPPGDETIDHFRPKSGPHARRDLGYAWENLFYCCNHCQKQKRDLFDDALLKPDEEDYEFLKYFQWEFATGTLMPSEVASDEDQHRAERTIELLGLNVRHPQLRVKALTKLNARPEDLDEYSYRDFLEWAFEP